MRGWMGLEQGFQGCAKTGIFWSKRPVFGLKKRQKTGFEKGPVGEKAAKIYGGGGGRAFFGRILRSHRSGRGFSYNHLALREGNFLQAPFDFAQGRLRGAANCSLFARLWFVVSERSALPTRRHFGINPKPHSIWFPFGH